VDIGTTQVRFDLDEEDPRLRASAVRPDGGRSWFEHSVSRSDPGDRR
jgi:hypothetical protein